MSNILGYTIIIVFIFLVFGIGFVLWMVSNLRQNVNEQKEQIDKMDEVLRQVVNYINDQ
jgi:Flp pilus assembly protein TadB